MRPYDLIAQTLNNLSSEPAIIILKGFNNFLPKLQGSFPFGKTIPDHQLSAAEIIPKLTNNARGVVNDNCGGFLLYEHFQMIMNASLGGLLQASDKPVYILTNDFYSDYFPSHIAPQDFQNAKSILDDDKDHYLQKLYLEIADYKGKIYQVYNELAYITKTLKIDERNLSDTLEFPKIQLQEDKPLIFPIEINALGFANLMSQFIDIGHDQFIISADDLLKAGPYVKRLMLAQKCGAKIRSESPMHTSTTDPSDNAQQYLEILHRKNASFTFRDLRIYADPDHSIEKQITNQATIINDIYQNSLLAYEGKEFRDVYITASTGAGKSILFQIPAVALAEQYQLLTIVVSPLIGLMNDQVSNIQSITNRAVTINSDFTPIERDHILRQIKNHQADILYISPEALLANSDITRLIGDRQIGLFVVDEAHTTVTWGKSFRPDYWYLGEYIYKLRTGRYANYQFPIVTLTATASYGDDHSTTADIISSLKMAPNKYIGDVKRRDIAFDIRCHKVKKGYTKVKYQVAAKTINELIATGKKILVYVPFVSHIKKIKELLDHPEKVSVYHGGLPASEKEQALAEYKNGTINCIIATKAFGMGIDIDDIDFIYHFAPTGAIEDYVQEIGRAARRPALRGTAVMDFFPQDFGYINQLYGMSRITHEQLGRLIVEIYRIHLANNYEQNFVVSADDFAFIFGSVTREETINKVKTAMLMLKKDFESHGSSYPPLYFKPQSMFTYGYFQVSNQMMRALKEKDYDQYFQRMNVPIEHKTDNPNSHAAIYRVDFKALWEDHYRASSFGKFKSGFYQNELGDFNFEVGKEIEERAIITISSDLRLSSLKDAVLLFLDRMEMIFSYMHRSGKFYSDADFARLILEYSATTVPRIARTIVNSFISVLEYELKIENRFRFYNKNLDKYKISNLAYIGQIKALKCVAMELLDINSNKLTCAIVPKKSHNVYIVQILEMLELASCSIISGDRPEFHIRINNPEKIERLAKNKKYYSPTVASVTHKHYTSCILMSYFFSKLQTNEERWDFIEHYFLSMISDADIAQMAKSCGLDPKKYKQPNSQGALRQQERKILPSSKILTDTFYLKRAKNPADTPLLTSEHVSQREYTIDACLKVSLEQGQPRYTILAGSKIYPYAKFGEQPDIRSKELAELCGWNQEEILRQDISGFTSPSGAGQFVTGHSNNGWTSWKNTDDLTLDQIVAQETLKEQSSSKSDK